MTRLRTSPDQRSDRALPAVRPFLRSAGATPRTPPPTDLTDPGDADRHRDGKSTERYPTSRVRPSSQLMARGGLLAAVAIGCLGGLVGLLRSPGDGGAGVPPPSGDTDVLPGSVAGAAERAVEAWLTAGPDGDAAVDALFVEPPAPIREGEDAEPLTVDGATAVAGERLEDGYWTVIVAVDVVDLAPEAVPDAEDAAAAEASEAAFGEPPARDDEADGTAGRTTWYVEIGIVGNDAGRLAALTTPGVLPGPVDLEAGWTRDGPVADEPEPDDPLATMVDSFLDALLAGQGDPAPYLASGVDIPVGDQPPFADVTVDGLAVVELDDGELRVWVQATAKTLSGAEVPVAYEMVVAPRAERFDVLELWGSPTVTGAASGDEASDDEAESDGASTTAGDPATEPGTTAETTPETTATAAATTTLASEPGA